MYRVNDTFVGAERYNLVNRLQVAPLYSCVQLCLLVLPGESVASSAFAQLYFPLADCLRCFFVKYSRHCLVLCNIGSNRVILGEKVQ